MLATAPMLFFFFGGYSPCFVAEHVQVLDLHQQPR